MWSYENYREVGKRWSILVFIIDIVFSCVADEIIFLNGDVIHGRIIDQSDKHLTIEHPNLGVFQISTQQIQSYSIQSDRVKKSDVKEKTTHGQLGKYYIQNGWYGQAVLGRVSGVLCNHIT
jgi:hypothetical protein